MTGEVHPILSLLYIIRHADPDYVDKTITAADSPLTLTSFLSEIDMI